MAKGEGSTHFFKGIWDFFTSIRLTVALLLALAATSVIGTLIPQNQNPSAYFHQFGERLYRIFSALDLFDMYHSWWFQLMLLLLTLNIAICSINRLSATWKMIFNRNPGFVPSRFRKMANRAAFETAAPPDRAETVARDCLKRRFSFTAAESAEGSRFLFGEKGRWTRLGVYVVHASVILLLLGGLIGSFAGFEGFVTIPEGETRSAIRLDGNGRELDLGFAIRCDDFDVSFYENGAPKEFRSTLTILENGRETLRKDIVVNDPLRYKGVSIYQSSYGSIRPSEVTVSFTSAVSGMTYARKATIGQTIEIPEGMGRFTLRDYREQYNFMGMMNLGESFIGELAPPEGEQAEVALPLRHPDFDKMIVKRGIRESGVMVAITDYAPRYYTGLQVNRDPGVWVVYLGFIVMIIGFYITFYMSHQRVCVEVAPGVGTGAAVAVSGVSDKNRIGMDSRARRMARDLERQLSRNLSRLG